jgi:hypothetical protein
VHQTQLPNAIARQEKKPVFGTRFQPRKPIDVPGLRGEEAHITVAIAMDHPSRGLLFPSRSGETHAPSIPKYSQVRQGCSTHESLNVVAF